MKYLDEHSGQVYRYRSMLRPVASLGYDRIPNILLEPGSDPDGTRREFVTSAPLPASLLAQWDIEFEGVANQGAV